MDYPERALESLPIIARKIDAIKAPMRDEDRDRAPIPQDWRDEFYAAAARPLHVRMRYAFIHTYKPVLDDEPY